MLLLVGLNSCGGTAVRVAADPPTHPSSGAIRIIGRLTPPPGEGRFTPTFLAVDPKGRLLVADEARGAIFAYDRPEDPPIGWLAAPIGQSGGSPRFVDIRGMVASAGLNLFVLDGGTGRIYQFDLSYEARGLVLDLAGERLVSRFGDIRATALAIDPSGQPIVVDAAGDRLLVFDPQWSPRFDLGGPGASAGGFRDPAGVAIGPGGRIWVADRGNRLVSVLDPVGAFLVEHEFDHAPESLAIDSSGNVYVGDAAGVVTILSRDGGRATMPPGRAGGGTAYVALSPDGRRLFVARPVAGIVEVYEVVPAAMKP
ncbi:MAG: NHL repeat-containing protein [Candidatus Eisenbacteria bacterium]|nr:NHL repeat-containing protein [Candidatus Eisenbacteria bacterium]